MFKLRNAPRKLAALTAVTLLGVALSATPALAQVWQASSDYSNTQGHLNWRYMTFRTYDSTYWPMVYGFNYFGFESWFGGLDEFGNANESAIMAWGMHPSGGDYEAARVWESPLTGTVRVTGTVAESDSSPRNPAYPVDGVQVSIWKNDELLYSADIEDSDLVGYSYDLSVQVMPGDWLSFRVHKRSTANYDSTYFDPRITVTSLSGGSGGSWIADVLSAESDYMAGLDLSLFEGQNNHARSGRRLVLSHDLKVASNLVSGGETTAAIENLLNVVVRLGSDPNIPDWMVDSPEKIALQDDIWAVINLLGLP